MADGTTIEWTDATWNPITGCQVKSPGCKFCYAMKLAGTRLKHHPSREGLTVDTKNGPVWNGRVRLNREWLGQPRKWTKPRMIFVCAHSDLFYEEVPDEWIDWVFVAMALSPKHIFQVLTKRPDRMLRYLNASNRLYQAHEPLKNVWLGTSVEDQPRANERRAPMAALAELGWTTWASYEPALGQVDWTGWEFLRWMVSGGESGQGARPTHPDWHRATRDFCAPHDIPYLFKQWGEWAPAGMSGWQRETITVLPDGRVREWGRGEGRLVHPAMAAMRRLGKKAAGRALDGVIHDGFPQVAA
ncbi:phage Gp37/Gp68 family protein [Mesorhizobium amorphae]|uniref:phage Gp37/Gp68 family protein n=1 Tax=Mesorhizobium amorphae TaxID=71433 RepID=UPI003ECC2982